MPILLLVHKPTAERGTQLLYNQLGEGSVQEEATDWALWGPHLSRATSQSPGSEASGGGGCHSWSVGPVGASGWVASRDPGQTQNGASRGL